MSIQNIMIVADIPVVIEQQTPLRPRHGSGEFSKYQWQLIAPHT